MGVSKNGGTPNWMVKIMENPIKIHDLGGGVNTPIFGSTPIYLNRWRKCAFSIWRMRFVLNVRLQDSFT